MDSREVDVSDMTPAQFWREALRKSKAEFPEINETALREGLNLVRAANSLVQAAEETIHRPSGWSWAGFRIMYIIWITDTIEARNISRLASVTRQTTSSVLATLERDGLIVRERISETDRRLVSVRLTPRGNDGVLSALRQQNRLETTWFSSLPEHDQRLLADLLVRVLVHDSDDAH